MTDMVIITIAFKRGGKGYDYLLLNPDRVKIDRSEPLRVVTGAGPRDYIPTTALSAKKVGFLPPHVTKAIRLYEDNEARMAEMPKPDGLPKPEEGPLEKEGPRPIDPEAYRNYILERTARSFARMKKRMKRSKYGK